MCSGIIQTAITKRLPLELDDRKPSNRRTGEVCPALACDSDKNNGGDPWEIEFYCMWDLI